MHLVYVLHSIKLDRFYIGETADFDVRKDFHDHAPSNKFTAKAKDWTLFLTIECLDKIQALSIEAHIKRMKSSVYIRNLKKYPEMVSKFISPLLSSIVSR